MPYTQRAPSRRARPPLAPSPRTCPLRRRGNGGRAPPAARRHRPPPPPPPSPVLRRSLVGGADPVARAGSGSPSPDSGSDVSPVPQITSPGAASAAAARPGARPAAPRAGAPADALPRQAFPEAASAPPALARGCQEDPRPPPARQEGAAPERGRGSGPLWGASRPGKAPVSAGWGQLGRDTSPTSRFPTRFVPHAR